MANLGIENLGRSVGLDQMRIPTERLSPDANPRFEQTVADEMTKNGMGVPTSAAGNANTFSDILRKSVDQVNQAQVEADSAVKEMIAGRNKNIHETMLTVERADISLKLMMQVRNKIIDAYKEIMRMQV